MDSPDGSASPRSKVYLPPLLNVYSIKRPEGNDVPHAVIGLPAIAVTDAELQKAFKFPGTEIFFNPQTRIAYEWYQQQDKLGFRQTHRIVAYLRKDPTRLDAKFLLESHTLYKAHPYQEKECIPFAQWIRTKSITGTFAAASGRPGTPIGHCSRTTSRAASPECQPSSDESEPKDPQEETVRIPLGQNEEDQDPIHPGGSDPNPHPPNPANDEDC